MSKLTETQHSMLTAWLLNKEYSIEDIRKKVEAPAPQGFGLPVQRNTLRRLRARFDNANCNAAISDSLDLACDILEPEDAAETAPLLQSLIVMLYSRALFAMKMQAEPSAIDKLVSTIARLERLKSRSHRESRERSPLTTRHHVELSVLSPTSSDLQPQPAPKIIDLNVTALPDTKKELERSDAGRQNTPNPVP